VGWCRREEVAGMTMRMRRRALGLFKHEKAEIDSIASLKGSIYI
jgi:hypothetical protein